MLLEKATGGVHVMLRLRLAIVMAATVLGAANVIGFASAAQPAIQGCVGSSVSGNARATARYGQVISSVATDGSGLGGPGVGSEVQAVQAGQVSDALFPNTCNG